MTKRGTPPPQNFDKRGPLLFVDREVFNVHVIVGINPTAQQDVCASTVHYSSYIHHHYCIRTAKCPTACGTSTLLSKKPNVHTGNSSAQYARNIMRLFLDETHARGAQIRYVTHTYVWLFGEESACTRGRRAFGCSDTTVMVNI